MYSKLQSIWAPSATYKINKWTQTEQSHITQLKQYSLSHLVYNTHLLTITDQATGGKHDRESVGVTAGGYVNRCGSFRDHSSTGEKDKITETFIFEDKLL